MTNQKNIRNKQKKFCVKKTAKPLKQKYKCTNKKQRYKKTPKNNENIIKTNEKQEKI